MPDPLREIRRSLDPNWSVIVWQRYNVFDNWIAGLEFCGRHFRLVSDRGYVEVYEITGGQENQIVPPKDQLTSISPKQVYELLAKAVA
jgi:hypothetical protein